MWGDFRCAGTFGEGLGGCVGHEQLKRLDERSLEGKDWGEQRHFGEAMSSCLGLKGGLKCIQEAGIGGSRGGV